MTNIFSTISENSASLILGKPLSGEKEFLYKYIVDSFKKNEPVLFITTDKSPEEIKRDLIKNKIFYGRYETEGIFKFIDCYSSQTEESLPDTNAIKRISGPLALNEISIALSEAEKDFFKKSNKHRVIFNSLSTVLMYSNEKMVGRFIQVLIARIKKANGSVLLIVEEGMHEQKVVVTIEHMMDIIINVKKEKEKVFIKAKGASGFEEWTELSQPSLL